MNLHLMLVIQYPDLLYSPLIIILMQFPIFIIEAFLCFQNAMKYYYFQI